jgi:CheY-like chemotaxis protein
MALPESQIGGRALIKLVLGMSKTDVATADSAVEDWAFLKNQRAEIAISAIGMPEKDGYDFIPELSAFNDLLLDRDTATAISTATARLRPRPGLRPRLRR